MFCEKCGAKIGGSASFCSKCGCKINKKRFNSTNSSSSTQYPVLSAVSHFNELAGRKKSRLLGTFLTFSLISAGLFVYGSVIGNYEAAVSTSIVLFVLLAFFADISSRSQAQYYAAQGTRTADGEHCCYNCGHKGIYKRTPYKTNSTINACSKCKTYLFTS